MYRITCRFTQVQLDTTGRQSVKWGPPPSPHQTRPCLLYSWDGAHPYRQSHPLLSRSSVPEGGKSEKEYNLSDRKKGQLNSDKPVQGRQEVGDISAFSCQRDPHCGTTGASGLQQPRCKAHVKTCPLAMLPHTWPPGLAAASTCKFEGRCRQPQCSTQGLIPFMAHLIFNI